MFGRRDTVLLRVELARLEGTVATLVATVATGFKDHEDRLRRREKWQYSIPLSAVAVVAGAVATFFSHH